MKLNGRMSFTELHVLVAEIRDTIIGKFLKKVYHFENKWLFKFNNISLVFEPGYNVWVGEFQEREKDIDSICNKIRKEILDHKIVDMGIYAEGRTMYIQFYNHFLFFELFAAGNLILTDLNRNIMVLKRQYKEITHKNVYEFNPLLSYELQNYVIGWNKNNYEVSLEAENKEFDTWRDAIAALWKVKYSSKEKVKQTKAEPKRKFLKTDSIQNQINKFNTKISEIQVKIDQLESQENKDYDMITKTYSEKKLLVQKQKKAIEHLSEIKPTDGVKKNKKQATITIKHNKWYHEYHWWYTKNKFLVVGGKNADQNEKLVKTYMKPTDLYFHSDEPGSGSYIMLMDTGEKKENLEVDFEETAHGVVALTQLWKSTTVGRAFYVNGDQVSKTAPSGEFIGKGSFMIKGTRNYIKIENFALGYCLIDNEQLMMAPYRIISRHKTPTIRLTPKFNSKKGIQKELTKKIKDTFKLSAIPENLYIFSFPSTIFVKCT